MTDITDARHPFLTLRMRGISVSAISLALWLLATLIAMFLAMMLKDSAFVDGQYIPRSNDSFYHARRILDAVIGDRGFYQFDERLHVPEGSWIPWPWAYDYLMAKATQLALWFNPDLDPMAFLSRVPVAWLAVNAALFLGAVTALGLSIQLRAVAMLAYALSPLVQQLHAIGMIDHHFIEHSFVLLTILLGLRWFTRPDSASRAIVMAIALGVAPAFHNGLFILQLPVLGCIALLWLAGSEPPARPMRHFAAWLVAASLLSALPSEALRQGMFEFALLSWFHVYVAACTAVTIALMSAGPYSARRLVVLIAAAMLLAIPILSQIRHGAQFMAGELSVLGEIAEVQSPLRMMMGIYGPVGTAGFYSWLILFAPLLLVWYAYRVVREREPLERYYAIWVVFGLGLLLTQFRFHYFGLFVLITSGLAIVDGLCRRHAWHEGVVLAATLAAILVLYQPALRQRLFTIYAPAGDSEYASTRPLYARLAELCAEKPGLVLADSDDGNPVIFHTDCSVIANNFIMRAEDIEKLAEVSRLMSARPVDVLRHEPRIDYLLLRASDFDDVSDVAHALLSNDELPAGFELVDEVLYGNVNKKVYARLFRLYRTN